MSFKLYLMRDYIDYLIVFFPKALDVQYEKSWEQHWQWVIYLQFDTAELINVIHLIIQLKKVGLHELLFIGINWVILFYSY
jgi:hypothetical protein